MPRTVNGTGHYVEKFLGLKHHVGVACIGCVYLSKAAGAFTFAVALLIAQALEPRFENLYDPVAGAFSWGGFTYTDECIADGAYAASFLAKTRDAIAFAASYGVVFLLLTALVFLVYGCLALKAADGSVAAARRVYVFTTALAVLCVFGLFDETGFVALILTAYAAVVTRSHWIQLLEASTPAYYASVVGEDSPAKPAADKV